MLVILASLQKAFFWLYSKDVRLPVQLQRAMAAEAEAAREARAKVSTSWIILLLWSSPFLWEAWEKAVEGLFEDK